MKNKKNTTIVVKEWLKDHPLINLAGLCKMAGVDKGNFNRWLKSDKSLSEKALSSIMQQLFHYGYKWFELPKEEKTVAKKVDQAEKKETILISENTKEIPPMPVRAEGEDQFDFAARKNEWKRLYA